MDFERWISLVLLFGAGGLTPGPAVALVMSTALRYGVKPSVLPALGISTANIFWLVLAASGAALVLEQMPAALLGLKLAGLALILWIAWGVLNRPPGGPNVTALDSPKRHRLFARGLALQIANPAALVFFGFMLPSFFDPSRPVWPQFLIMTVTITATEMAGLMTYAFGAQSLSRKMNSPVFSQRFNRIIAFTMVATVIWGAFIADM